MGTPFGLDEVLYLHIVLRLNTLSDGHSLRTHLFFGA